MAIFSTICFTIKFLLCIYGIWPATPCIALRRLFWSTTLILAQVFQYAYFVLHFRTDDLADLMDNLSCCLTHSLLFFKLMIFWINQGNFRSILKMMATDWKNCANNPFTLHVTTMAANLSHRISNMIIVLHIAAAAAFSYGVFLSKHDDDIFNVSTVYVRPFILKMEFPFDSNSSPMYETIMITQFFHLEFLACAIGVVNALMLALILHAGAQIDILHEWLTNIFSKESLHGITGIPMKNLIEKHQKIILFAENIENLYCYIALMQFVSNTLIICSIGFVIVTSVNSPNILSILVKTLLYYIIMNLEAFIFCFAGEYLSTKSQHIANAAYGSFWYDMHVNESQTMLFLMMRSQKRLTITIGKIMDLSLERFTSVLKTSMSYVSVLLAMS